MPLRKSVRVIASFVFVIATCVATAQTDPLPSWNDGPSKKAILDFVARVTKDGSPDFVPVAERIATFDNDGTLWLEYPEYTELYFTFERIHEMAPQHPEWKTKQPYAAVLANDKKAIAASGERGIAELFAASHTGVTTEEFSKIVTDWFAKSTSARFKRPYTECVYQPMLEVLAYFRANGFKTYIVSGGEQEFMRPMTEKTYGIPPEQVVGTQFKMQYSLENGVPKLTRLAQLDSMNDGPGKPVNIQRFIGRRPIAAFGNSDGDQQMLEWTAAGSGARLAVLVHHTDAEREYAYDRASNIGKLDKALDEANAKHWVVIDMKTEWKTIFPPAAQ